MFIDPGQTPSELSLGSSEGIVSGHHRDGVLTPAPGEPASNQIRIRDVLRLHAKHLGSQFQ